MTRQILPAALAALILFANATLADTRTENIEAMNAVEAQLSCNMLADQEGATRRGAVRNVDYFLYACTFTVPAQRTITVEVMPLLHAAQARPICRSAAETRGGRWTGDWHGNGAFAPGTCTIRVPAS